MILCAQTTDLGPWKVPMPIGLDDSCSPFSMRRRWIHTRNPFADGRVATGRLPMSSRSSPGHTWSPQHGYIMYIYNMYISHKLIPVMHTYTYIYIYRCVFWLFTPGECSPFQPDLGRQELNEVAMAMDDPRQCARCGVLGFSWVTNLSSQVSWFSLYRTCLLSP